MNMCISVIYLFLFFLVIKWLFTLCLDDLVSTLSTVGFSLHLLMASYLLGLAHMNVSHKL